MVKRTSQQEKKLLAFGRRLAGIRRSKGMTQKDLAALVDMDYQHISALERGIDNPTYLRLHELAEALEVPMAELVS